MNMTQLQYFLIVHRYQNISRAAEEIHISRQALSQSIQELEAELDVTLFHRTRNGLVPTQAAEELVGHAHTILDEYAAISQLKSLSDLKKRELTVCVFDSIIDFLSPAFIRRWVEQNPDIILNIEESTDQGAKELLALGLCDFAIVTDAVNYSDFPHELLLRCQYNVLIHKDHPLAQKEVIEFPDLEGQPLIGKSSRIQYWKRDVNFILRQNINMNFIAEISNSAMARSLVEENVGIAMAWDYTSADLLAGSNVVSRPLSHEGWGCEIFLLESTRAVQDRKAELFKSFLKNWIRERMQ